MRVCLEGLRPALPLGTPAPVAALTARCVHEEPTSRPSFQELLELLPARGREQSYSHGRTMLEALVEVAVAVADRTGDETDDCMINLSNQVIS